MSTHTTGVHPHYRCPHTLQVSTHTTGLHPHYRCPPTLQVSTHTTGVHPPQSNTSSIRLARRVHGGCQRGHTCGRNNRSVMGLGYPNNVRTILIHTSMFDSCRHYTSVVTFPSLIMLYLSIKTYINAKQLVHHFLTNHIKKT